MVKHTHTLTGTPLWWYEDNDKDTILLIVYYNTKISLVDNTWKYIYKYL